MKLIFLLITSIFTISALANDITIPEISQELRDSIGENIDSLNDARVRGMKTIKPIINDEVITNIKNIKNTVIEKTNNQQDTVRTLLKQTIYNQEWKTKQQQFLTTITGKKDITSNAKSQTVSGGRLYFFISSSMPKDRLRRYIQELSKYPEARVVLQGFIGGSKTITPTISYIKSLITKQSSCLQYDCPNYKVSVGIDPVLFNRYQVTQVPTMVHVDNIQGANYCSEGNTDLVSVSNVKKFVGMVPIKYMLRELGVSDD